MCLITVCWRAWCFNGYNKSLHVGCLVFAALWNHHVCLQLYALGLLRPLNCCNCLMIQLTLLNSITSPVGMSRRQEWCIICWITTGVSVNCLPEQQRKKEGKKTIELTLTCARNIPTNKLTNPSRCDGSTTRTSAKTNSAVRYVCCHNTAFKKDSKMKLWYHPCSAAKCIWFHFTSKPYIHINI